MIINKPTVVITSLGRTGTKFFSKLFSLAVPYGTTLHQPDIVSRSKKITDQIKDSGFINLVVLRTIGRWSLIQLSDQYIKGIIDSEQAAEELLRQRKKFISQCEGSVYIESSSGYYGLINVLDAVFQNYRAAYFIRDGRDWVVSQYNWGGLYTKDLFLGKLKHVLGHKWLTAADFQNDPLFSDWEELTRFERICWAWATLNDFAVSDTLSNPRAALFKFEEIFSSKDKYSNLRKLLDFTLDLPRVNKVSWENLENILERPENQSAGSFPAWEQWTDSQQEFFDRVCGPLMKKAGYSY
jgi:hypothetical protein